MRKSKHQKENQSLVDSKRKRCNSCGLIKSHKDFWKDKYKSDGIHTKCKIHQSELEKNLYIDHNHQTGKVRGLLCNHCNTGLGHFKDSIENTIVATEYLIKHYEKS